MRIFFAGATGVIARHAIPELVRVGHEVYGSSRSWLGEAKLRRLGAHPVTLDATDADAVRNVLRGVRPDVVVNMLTDLKSPPSFRDLDGTMVGTNHLRTVVTDSLLTAALDVGVRRYIAQSFAGWFSEPRAVAAQGEPANLLVDPPRAATRTVGALRHLESTVTAAPGGVVLRFGVLYGERTSLGTYGQTLEDVKRRRIPVVGGGQGVWSFCHVEDAAHAVALAVDSEVAGLFEIVDHEPAPVHQWLPELARAVGAKAPRHVPAWLARPFIGDFGVHLMTAAQGASNDLAARELGFKPRHETWSEGFHTGLGG